MTIPRMTAATIRDPDPDNVDDLRSVIELKRAISPGIVLDESAVREEWADEGTVSKFGGDQTNPMYCRLVILRDVRKVQAVEILAPLATPEAKTLLGQTIAKAWSRWGAEAGGWEIYGILPSSLMARNVQLYAPLLIQSERLRAGTLLNGVVPLAYDVTRLSVATFRAMHDEALTWLL